METNTFDVHIVEDVETVRNNIVKVVSQDPRLRATSSRTGEEAVTYLINKRPDVAVIDLGLPGISGDETIRLARQGGYDKSIVILTANNEPSSIVRHIGIDADDYITKPFEHDVLLSYIWKNLKKSKATVDTVVTFGKYTFDTFHGTISGKGFETFKITEKRAKILEVLVRSKERCMKETTLLLEAYGHESTVEFGSLRRNVGRLNETFRMNGHENIITYSAIRNAYELNFK